MLAYLMDHATLILSCLLGFSEALALLFPSSSGFGGILAGLIKILKGAGIKEPGQG